MMAKARDFLSTWSVCQTPTCRLSTCDKDLIGLAGASVITEAARKKLGGVQPICKQTFAPGRFIRTVSPRHSHLHTSNLPARTIHSIEEDSPLTHTPSHFRYTSRYPQSWRSTAVPWPLRPSRRTQRRFSAQTAVPPWTAQFQAPSATTASSSRPTSHPACSAKPSCSCAATAIDGSRRRPRGSLPRPSRVSCSPCA